MLFRRFAPYESLRRCRGNRITRHKRSRGDCHCRFAFYILTRIATAYVGSPSHGVFEVGSNFDFSKEVTKRTFEVVRLFIGKSLPVFYMVYRDAKIVGERGAHDGELTQHIGVAFFVEGDEVFVLARFY